MNHANSYSIRLACCGLITVRLASHFSCANRPLAPEMKSTVAMTTNRVSVLDSAKQLLELIEAQLAVFVDVHASQFGLYLIRSHI